jgi:hypothetical protein
MLRIGFALVSTAVLGAQEPAPAPPVPDAIRRGAYLESEARSALFELCDRFGPRLTGSEPQRRAAQWAASRLEALGLRSVRHEFPLATGWRRGATSVRVVAPIERELTVVASGWSPPTDGVLRVALATALDTTGAVLIDPVRTPLVPRSEHPAPESTFVLVDAQRPYGLVPTGLATWVEPFEPGVVPAAFVSAGDAALLRRLLDTGSVELEVRLDAELLDGAQGVDVVADLRGDGLAEEVVLAVAKLDCWDVGPGAVDDAAGCVVLLEAARILASLPDRPKRTIRFALITGVEQGSGTAGYLARLGEADLARHVGGFAIEGGGGRLLGVMLAGHQEFLERAEAWFAPVRDLGVTDIGFRESAGHLPRALQGAGLPVFAMVQEAPERWIVSGTPADTPERILELDLMQGACVLAQGLWSWANE